MLLRFSVRADRRNFILGFDWKRISMAEPMEADDDRDRENPHAPSCASRQQKPGFHRNPRLRVAMKIVLNGLGDSAAHLQDGTWLRKCLAPPTKLHGNPICCVSASRAPSQQSGLLDVDTFGSRRRKCSSLYHHRRRGLSAGAAMSGQLRVPRARSSVRRDDSAAPRCGRHAVLGGLAA